MKIVFCVLDNIIRDFGKESDQFIAEYHASCCRRFYRTGSATAHLPVLKFRTAIFTKPSLMGSRSYNDLARPFLSFIEDNIEFANDITSSLFPILAMRSNSLMDAKIRSSISDMLECDFTGLE